MQTEWKSDIGIKIYGQTLREQFETLIAEHPQYKDARAMLHFMAGYYGHPSAPCIDAGVFLIAFTNAVNDGLMTWGDK